MSDAMSSHAAAIALGSNVGDRFQNVESALRLLEVPQDLLSPEDDITAGESPSLDIVDTSFMYETAPMYVTDQPFFINCACLIKTNIKPITLLKLLKKIEALVGRKPSIRNGPRAIDLDILLYDDLVMDTRPPEQRKDLENLQDQLVIPHPRLTEREFVLRPLNDMLPNQLHPVYRKTVAMLLTNLELNPDDPPMRKVVPFPRYPPPLDEVESESEFVHPSISPVSPTATYWTYPSGVASSQKVERKTHVMATLNITPDSFSHDARINDMEAAMTYVHEAVEAGCNIVDVGGHSTRPGAAYIDTQEEIRRVVPVIQSIRSAGKIETYSPRNTELDTRTRNILISVDTFRWEVAEESIKAGANCINDVYAFMGPDAFLANTEEEKKKVMEHILNMKRVARQYAVPVILMHSRADAGQHKDYNKYEYAGEPEMVLEGVRVELGLKTDFVVRGLKGVRRWLVIIDPGLGFSKTLEGNLEVLRSASKIISNVPVGQGSDKITNLLRGFPLLIGPSRKSFLGVILSKGEEGKKTSPSEREWATAAAVSCAVQQGALVVRVHNVKAMIDVIRVADAIWHLA